MTPPPPGVDAGPSEGLWLPLSEIARMRGVSKQAMSKRVARLEGLNALEVRSGPHGTRLINVAAFDKAAGEHVDAVRALNGAADRAPVATPGALGDPILQREQARRAGYQADLAEIELGERLGKLIEVATVEAAMIRCAEQIVRAIDQLVSRADEVAGAVRGNGTQGARQVLKTISTDLRKVLEREMRLAADEGRDASTD